MVFTSVTDLDDENTCSFCLYFYPGYYISNDLQDYKYIECTSCYDLVDIGASYCIYCNLNYDSNFWVLLKNESEGLLVRDTDDTDWIDNEDLSRKVTLCCEQHERDCKCQITIRYNDIWDIPSEVEQLFYDPDSHCSSCDFFFSAQCLPYRRMARDFLMTGELPEEQIQECDRFTNSMLSEEDFD